MKFSTKNPATNKIVGLYEEMKMSEVESILKFADIAHHQLSQTNVGKRAKMMREVAQSLRDNSWEYAHLMAAEMGKPLREGCAEVEKCAWVCDYYADNAEQFLAPEHIETDGQESFIMYQPLGVVLAVMPWNFPFWQVFRFAVPALMAGNAVVLKHATNVFGCALAIEQIFRDSGFFDYAFCTLIIDHDQVETIIRHPLIKAVTLTGSTEAGRSVAQQAGRALKKTVLELGGSDPYLILEDADLEEAVPMCVHSRLINSGQSCIAAKRFVVVASQRETFTERFVNQMQAARMGDPLDEATNIGPLARHDLRDKLHRQVKESVAKGATCLLGGEIPDHAGAYYPPTVLTNVGIGMPAYDEEIFGPVAAIIPVETEEEAVQVANDSTFGLGAAVFTKDLNKGRRIATQQLKAGACFVNTYVKSDPRLPFGGIKESGYGRELSHYGIKEFVNIKSVYIR